MIVIQALVVLSIMCALYFRFVSLIDHMSSKKQNNLRKLERVLFFIGLASNIVAVGAQTRQFTLSIKWRIKNPQGCSQVKMQQCAPNDDDKWAVSP